jgi:hypothetical protein
MLRFCDDEIDGDCDSYCDDCAGELVGWVLWLN